MSSIKVDFIIGLSAILIVWGATSYATNELHSRAKAYCGSDTPRYGEVRNPSDAQIRATRLSGIGAAKVDCIDARGLVVSSHVVTPGYAKDVR